MVFKITDKIAFHATESRLAKMQNLTKIKRNAAEQAEINVVEAERPAKAIKMENKDNNIKGQIEDAFLRFPHIGEKILEKLDNQSLFKCQKVSRPWQDFIAENTKIQKGLAIEVLQKNTLISKARLKKSMHKHDLKIVQTLANCAINECKGMATDENITPRVWQAKLMHHILFYKNIDSIQYLLMELILQNVMDTNDTNLADKVLNNVDVAFSKYRRNRAHDWLFWEGIRRYAGWGYEYYEDKELVSWSNILLIAVVNGHFSICKSIIEILKDVQKASNWGETLIAVGNLGYNGINVHRDDICRLLRNSFQIQK